MPDLHASTRRGPLAVFEDLRIASELVSVFAVVLVLFSGVTCWPWNA